MFFVHPQIKLNKLKRADLIKKLELYFPAKQLIFTDMGRSAFKIIIEKLNLHDSEIIMPAYICDIFLPILEKYNIKPIFLDISLKTFHIKREEILRKITPKTKAILVCHTYGLPFDVDALRSDLRGRTDLVIIEDCAHAFGIKPKSEIAFFSLYKQFPALRGGLLVCPKDWQVSLPRTSFSFRDLLSFLNCFGIFAFIFKRFGKDIAPKVIRKEKMMTPAGINKVSLNLFSYSLTDFEESLEERKKTAIYFQEELKKIGFEVQESKDNLFCCLSALTPKNLEEKRDEIVEKLRKYGVFCTRIWHGPMALDKDELPNTFEAARRIINFPLQNHYAEEDVKKMIEAVKQAIKEVRPPLKFERRSDLQKSMKVLMPVLHYWPVIGGLEIWTRSIAEGMALRHGSKQAEIFVVTGRVSGQPSGETKNRVKISRTALFPLVNLSYSSPFYIFTALPFIFLKSLFTAKKEKINLLHCQGFLSAFLGYLILKICGIPYVVTLQSLQGKSRLKKMVYKKAAYCIAASSAIKEYFEEIGCKNIEVIPNGIDLKRFEHLKRESHDGFIVMTVARLEKVKGIEYLIRAMAKFVDTECQPRLVDTRCQQTKLLVIGDGSERGNLENLAKQLGLEDRVKFVGQVQPERIPEYLVQADCFVLPSLKEGFGIAVLEAMAAGIPVIASRVGGILDIIEDKKTGLLIEPGDPEEITKAILNIYNNSQLKERLITSALAGLKRYDWQNVAERVYEIYSKLA